MFKVAYDSEATRRGANIVSDFQNTTSVGKQEDFRHPPRADCDHYLKFTRQVADEGLTLAGVD